MLVICIRHIQQTDYFHNYSELPRFLRWFPCWYWQLPIPTGKPPQEVNEKGQRSKEYVSATCSPTFSSVFAFPLTLHSFEHFLCGFLPLWRFYGPRPHRY